jgi:hypothetical protein
MRRREETREEKGPKGKIANGWMGWEEMINGVEA